MVRVYTDMRLSDFEAWNGAESTLGRILDEDKGDLLEDIIRSEYPEGLTEEELNDMLLDESDLFDRLGIEDEDEENESLQAPILPMIALARTEEIPLPYYHLGFEDLAGLITWAKGGEPHDSRAVETERVGKGLVIFKCLETGRAAIIGHGGAPATGDWGEQGYSQFPSRLGIIEEAEAALLGTSMDK